MKKKIELLSLLAGIVFLVSSVAKSVDIAVFSSIVTQYGFRYAQFLTPLIVWAEALVGLLLVFQIQIKRTSFAGVLLLVAFTVIYAYGVFFKGIEDCGCFGKITLLNTSPVFTFIRNAILLCILIVLWRKGDNKMKLDQWVIAIIVMVMSLISFMSGYAYRNVKNPTNKYTVEAIENTVLKDFVTTSKDSTYLVFAFTYTCPHCLNSIENLKQYEISGAVDKVIGIALENPDAEKQFMEIFKPDFVIKNYPAETFFRIAKTFPRAYYIKNDSVMAALSGELPCSYVFMNMK